MEKIHTFQRYHNQVKIRNQDLLIFPQTSYGTHCITSKKIKHKKYVIMCWRVRKRRNSTGSECSVRFPSGKHTMTSMCLVLVIRIILHFTFYLHTLSIHMYTYKPTVNNLADIGIIHLSYVGNIPLPRYVVEGPWGG